MNVEKILIPQRHYQTAERQTEEIRLAAHAALSRKYSIRSSRPPLTDRETRSFVALNRSMFCGVER